MGEFHPSVAFVLQFFAFAHLREPLRRVSSAFAVQALCVARESPSNQETVVALRKLLESKDAGVRSFVAAKTIEEERDPLQWVKDYDEKRAQVLDALDNATEDDIL